MIETFIVMGEPRGKERPRTVRNNGRTMTYTPAKTVAYEALIRLEYGRQTRGTVFEDSVYMLIDCYTMPPKSASKLKRQCMLDGDIRPQKKPDLDNIAKAVCDALKGVAYRDDTQVVDVRIRRWYGVNPGIWITLGDYEIQTRGELNEFALP